MNALRELQGSADVVPLQSPQSLFSVIELKRKMRCKT